jgi:hypothetical protein
LGESMTTSTTGCSASSLYPPTIQASPGPSSSSNLHGNFAIRQHLLPHLQPQRFQQVSIFQISSHILIILLFRQPRLPLHRPRPPVPAHWSPIAINNLNTYCSSTLLKWPQLHQFICQHQQQLHHPNPHLHKKHLHTPSLWTNCGFGAKVGSHSFSVLFINLLYIDL